VLAFLRCLLTGQIDRVPIEPGLYKSGNPSEKSPIIVTSNYKYTFIKIMRGLKGSDAWVLCVDSDGINVWCAARGDDFGNKQLIEAIKATNVQNLVKEKTLILPQLSAGGISAPNLHDSKKFPFKIKFGPIWSKHLPEYLEKNPIKKPERMRVIKFSLGHRLRALITHLTFLIRKVFIYQLTLVAVLLLIFEPFIHEFNLFLEILFAIILTNTIMPILLPMTGFTRSFILKGLFFGTLNVILLSIISWILYQNSIIILLSIPFFFWIAFFSTMSFSGFTMHTSPSEIRAQYSKFKIINLILLVISIISLCFRIFF